MEKHTVELLESTGDSLHADPSIIDDAIDSSTARLSSSLAG